MTNLFGHSVRSDLLALFLAEGLACFGAFYLILSLGAPGASAQVDLAAFAALLALCAGLIAGATGLYQPERWLRANRLAAGTMLGAVVLLGITHVLFPTIGSASWAAQAALVASFVLSITFTRIAFAAARRSGFMRPRLVLVRAATAGAEDGNSAFFDVAGVATPDTLTVERVRAMRASLVVADARGLVAPDLAGQLAEAGISVLDRAEFIERATGRVDFATLAPDWLASARGAQDHRLEAFVRRSLDIALGVALLLFTFPLLVATALAIKLDSPGPVFYRQERVGKGGRPYTLFKFRSMRTDAEATGAPVWATQQDARVTRVGRFIRLTRIDEIPQVFNVLKGDMAFVGPRPERPGFVEKLAAVIPHYDDRHCVKPGITGWAQVNYPYGASVEDARQKLAYDLYYVRRRSLFLDLLIIVATVRVVLFQEGSR